MTGESTGPAPTSAVAAAAHALAGAFRARDVDAALACFAAAGEVLYAGSEPGELAVGREPLRRLFAGLFARPEAYDWRVLAAVAVPAAGGLYVWCETRGSVHPDDGPAATFPYRLSGLLEGGGDAPYRWRAVHGSEPAPEPLS